MTTVLVEDSNSKLSRHSKKISLRDVILIFVINLLLTIMTMDMLKPRTQDVTPMLEIIGTTFGQVQVLEVKPPQSRESYRTVVSNHRAMDRY